MIRINSKFDCCGCTACASACPKKCITMKKDDEGFIYPVISKNDCIDCRLCERVCPMLNRNMSRGSIKGFYIGRDFRIDIVKSSTSGGMFTILMEHFIKNDGVVYGVVCDSDMHIRHVRVDSLSDGNFYKIKGSKYVKSDIVGIFCLVKADLDREKLVLFSGTPCQISGLKAFLRKDYKNLFAVDVVCRGNPSPLFWEKYVEYQEKKANCRICEAVFRNKTYGYHSGSMKIVFENGKQYYASSRVDLFLHAFFDDLCSRPSCYKCAFKGVVHCSDLTLFDSWHASAVNKSIDKNDDYGFTNIIVQSDKGMLLLNSIKDEVLLYESSLEKAIELDGIMVEKSVNWNSKRESFLLGLNKAYDFKKYCKSFMKITTKDYIIEKSKKLYYWKKMKKW